MECTYHYSEYKTFTRVNTRNSTFIFPYYQEPMTYIYMNMYSLIAGRILQSIPAPTVVKELHGDISQKTIS